MPPRYREDEARAAIARSTSFSDALRKLGMRPAGGNHRTLKKYVELWGISTHHFHPEESALVGIRLQQARIPLERVLVKDSTYPRGRLKRRLYAAGLKQRRCELCGQGEEWRGRRMALILDHINGVADDNRLENLRIVCPNCAATLDTHCGRNLPRLPTSTCELCGQRFAPHRRGQRFCSRGVRAPTTPARAAPRRPPALRAAHRRNRGHERPRGRAEVRRVGQRDPEMGAAVRARARQRGGPRRGGRRRGAGGEAGLAWPP